MKNINTLNPNTFDVIDNLKERIAELESVDSYHLDYDAYVRWHDELEQARCDLEYAYLEEAMESGELR